MASLKVFGLPASTDVSRVLTCLMEKDLEFQLIRIDTYKGEHKVPEFLQLQDPSGQVTFKDGTKTLVDSREICKYVCEKYPEKGNKKLMGTGSLERASIEQWLQSEQKSFDPPSSDLVFHLAFAPLMNQTPDENLIKQRENELCKILDVYERKLQQTKYLAGDEFTLADLSHLPNAHYIINKTPKGRHFFIKRKNVNRWWEAISSRSSWKNVVNMQGMHPGPLEN